MPATFTDFLSHKNDEVAADENGKAVCKVNARSISVWVRSDI